MLNKVSPAVQRSPLCQRLQGKLLLRTQKGEREIHTHKHTKTHMFVPLGTHYFNIYNHS